MMQKMNRLTQRDMYKLYCKETKGDKLTLDDFNKAIKTINSHIIEEYLLKGKPYLFGYGLSGIRVVKFKNKFNPKIHWGNTMKATKEYGEKTVVYNTNPWKLWVQWFNKGSLTATNSTVYRFISARQNKAHDRLKIKSLNSRIYEELNKNELFLLDLTTV